MASVILRLITYVLSIVVDSNGFSGTVPYGMYTRTVCILDLGRQEITEYDR